MARPRDPELDRRILAATGALLTDRGVHELTFDAVAEEAGTSRPTIYRRYDSLEELVVAALAELAAAAEPERTGDHLLDLERELADFRDALVRLRSINVAASVLLDDTDERVKAAYRAHVVAPHRARLRAILDAAAAEGRLHPEGEEDIEIAVTLGPGSWYAHALAGLDPPADWPSAAARLIWRSLGGIHSDVASPGSSGSGWSGPTPGHDPGSSSRVSSGSPPDGGQASSSSGPSEPSGDEGQSSSTTSRRVNRALSWRRSRGPGPS